MEITLLRQVPVSQDARRLFQCSRKILCRFHSEKSNPLFLSGRPNKTFGRPSVFRRFKQFKVESVWTSWQHVRTLFRVWQKLGFPLQTCIWEDSCIRPDDKATLSKTSPYYGKRRGEELQPFGRQGNTVRTLGQHRSDIRATSSGRSTYYSIYVQQTLQKNQEFWTVWNRLEIRKNRLENVLDGFKPSRTMCR